MGETITIGEFEFLWELGSHGSNYSLSVFITKPRLLKFANEFTPKQLEEFTKLKFGNNEFVNMVRAALRKSSPRVTVAYSFVDNISTIQYDNLELLNKPEKSGSMVLIVSMRSEFDSTSVQRFFIPLKSQKPEVEEMLALMQKPSTNTKSIEEQQQVVALAREIESLKKEIDVLQGDISRWKGNSNRISKLEDGQNQLSLHQIKNEVENQAKTISQLQKDLVVVASTPNTTPQLPVVPQQVSNHGHVIFAQLQNGTLSTNGGYWTWNEVVAMPTGHFMLTTKSYANDTLTVLQPGLYELGIMVTTSSSANSYTDLYKNGSAVSRFYSSDCSNYSQSYNINNIYQCNANDYFWVYTWYPSGNPVNGKPHNYFTALKLGTTQQY